MKYLAKILALVALATAFSLTAKATITLTFQAEDILQGGVGSSEIPAGALVLVVADTTGGGFNTLTTGNISVGAKFGTGLNDLVVGRLAISSPSFLTNNEAVLNSSLSSVSFFGDWTNGEDLAIYWISSLTSSDSNVGVGVTYGMYTNASDLTSGGGSPAWVTPSDGSTSTFFFSTSSPVIFGTGASNVPASAGYSTLTTVIPEPSTFALLGGVVALGIVARRRKTATAV